MGGFCGFLGSVGDTRMVLDMMNRNIHHRFQGECEAFLDENIALGGRVFDERESMGTVLAFDGIIYNLEELRELVDENCSELEVILQLYKKFGTAMLSRLRGVFAFVIYDNGRLFCARDIFGAKPFYYMPGNDAFVFGSEIKAFLAHPHFTPVVNTEALGQYLTFQYSVLEETFFKGIFKLPAGCFLVWEGGEAAISRYNSHSFAPEDLTLAAAVDGIDAAVCESVKRHVTTDDIGAFLSGGVDSGYMAATFGGKTTFTVGFDYDNYNEIEYAQELSEKLGINNISKIISTEEYWQSLAKIQYHMDEPMADPASVAFYFACREAAQHVKIAFSGEGADEFFGGYNIYREPLSLRFYTMLPLRLRKWLASLAKRLPVGTRGRGFVIRGSKPVEERFFGNAFIFSEEERNQLLKFPTTQSPTDVTRPFYDMVKHEDDITKMQFLDIHLWLTDDILLQADKMSAAHGLQIRTPLMDREVLKMATRLPVKYRVNKKDTKYAFRQAAARHLPPETAHRKKLGFPVPIRIWLREEKYYNVVREYFGSEAAEKYFHTSELLNLLDAHYSKKQDNSRKIWTVYMFLLWHDEFFKLSSGESTPQLDTANEGGNHQ